jgi:hypothetical protein
MKLKELDTLNSILLKAKITSLHDTLCILGAGAAEFGIRWHAMGITEEEKKYKKLCDQIDKALKLPSLDDMLKDGD